MKKYLISILCSLFLLPGCDYLNMVPEKDIETIESVFEQRTKVEGWWIGVYADLISLLQSSDKNLAFSASAQSCFIHFHQPAPRFPRGKRPADVTRALREYMGENVSVDSKSQCFY